MDRLKGQEAIGEAHAKLILVGEHIVVYNKPAIVLPFPLKLRAWIKGKPGEISISSDLYTGNIHAMSGRMVGLFECINRSFELCNRPKEGVHIDITSDIPEGRGLGFSAAAATAIVRGIYRYFEKELSEEELFTLVELAETYAHGNPSGIDMLAVSREAPILFQKQEKPFSLQVPRAFHIVVADTGMVGDTKKAVDHVRLIKIQRPDAVEDIINQIEAIVVRAKEAILEGDAKLLGSLLLRNHEKLKELEVSNNLLDHLVEAAIGAGALGAKLTGGGMGGCMLALTKDIESARMVSKRLLSEGAKDVWYFSTDSNNLYRKEDL